MKKLLTTPEQLIGKTISTATFPVYETTACIIFTDDTAVLIHAYEKYEGDTRLEIVAKADDYELRNFGLITEEEYQERVKKNEEKYKKQEQIAKRRQYEMLKREFEGEVSP